MQIVADERGQEADRAEAPMRAADLDDRIDAWIVVEQHAAAAVDLRVDESRQQESPCQIVLAVGAPAPIALRRLP